MASRCRAGTSTICSWAGRRHRKEGSEWASYVCLIGPALKVGGLARRVDAGEITEYSLAQGVQENFIDLEIDNLEIGAEVDGRAIVTYRRPEEDQYPVGLINT